MSSCQARSGSCDGSSLPAKSGRSAVSGRRVASMSMPMIEASCRRSASVLKQKYRVNTATYYYKGKQRNWYNCQDTMTEPLGVWITTGQYMKREDFWQHVDTSREHWYWR